VLPGFCQMFNDPSSALAWQCHTTSISSLAAAARVSHTTCPWPQAGGDRNPMSHMLAPGARQELTLTLCPT